MSDKVIIAVQGKSRVGKSETIKLVDQKLQGKKDVVAGDIREMFSYKGKLIGIASVGDPNSAQFDDLKILADSGCDIILGACRTGGQTVENIHTIAGKYVYKIIWTSNYRNEAGHATIRTAVNLNDLFSDALIVLIDNLL